MRKIIKKTTGYFLLEDKTNRWTSEGSKKISEKEVFDIICKDDVKVVWQHYNYRNDITQKTKDLMKQKMEIL